MSKPCRPPAIRHFTIVMCLLCFVSLLAELPCSMSSPIRYARDAAPTLTMASGRVKPGVWMRLAGGIRSHTAIKTLCQPLFAAAALLPYVYAGLSGVCR
ncbi:hypothetical protein GGI35DRAFT_152567 [Trichoderma velutinum]